jgi:hypothetical protein
MGLARVYGQRWQALVSMLGHGLEGPICRVRQQAKLCPHSSGDEGAGGDTPSTMMEQRLGGRVSWLCWSWLKFWGEVGVRGGL